MHYISPWTSLNIIQQNGETGSSSSVYLNFFNGELTIGDPTISGSGNEIVPNLSATDGTALIQVYPSGTDLRKIGMGVLSTDAVFASQLQGDFYEAPYKTLAGSPALVTGLWYRVVAGPITHNGVVYVAGTRFKATASASFTGAGGIVYQDLDAVFYRQFELNQRANSFGIIFTGGDDVVPVWDDSKYAPTPSTFGRIR